MAKKSTATTVKKVATAPKKNTTASKPKAPKAPAIEKICADALIQLKSLNVESDLQAGIEWCLGSYRHDKNPSGLFTMAEKALAVLTANRAKNAKGVPASLLKDLASALKSK
jgi:hypothetical protein